MVAAMSNIYLLHRVSVIQRRDNNKNNKDNKDDENNKDFIENDDMDNINADHNNVAEVFTSSLERPSDVTKCYDYNTTTQRRISFTDSECKTQNEKRVEDQTFF